MERALWSNSNSNSLECRRHARGNPSWRSSQVTSTGIITKTISRMRSDKADISSAIVNQMLYSTCICETGTVEVFGLICNIISSVSIEWNWQYEHRQRGCSEQRLEVIKQLIRVLECILERHIRQRVEIDEMQCRFMSGHGGTTVAVFILSQLQKLLLTSNKPFYATFINIEKESR